MTERQVGGDSGDAPAFSIVLATYNRARDLGAALGRLLALRPDSPTHEIIVVDNNSKDDTRAVVEGYAARHPGSIRYLFEGRQGVSYARNSGVASARGSVIAFTDDDVLVSADWLVAARDGLARHADAAFVGGKCLPIWTESPPAWITPDCWGPLALFDYGDDPFPTSIDHQRVQGAGNMAIWREVFERVGGFDAATQHAAGAVSAAEDHQLNVRVWQLGLRGWYIPEMVIYAEVPPARMTRRYYRRWHDDHGRVLVRMLPPEHLLDREGRVVSAPHARRIFGVPESVWRSCAWHARQCVANALAARWINAFKHELAARELIASGREFARSAAEGARRGSSPTASGRPNER